MLRLHTISKCEQKSGRIRRFTFFDLDQISVLQAATDSDSDHLAFKNENIAFFADHKLDHAHVEWESEINEARKELG